ncbi:MAG: LysR family transcriptional regulator [Clostridia bacterium]|nr:LysR family transcriptional regulator [Clostridia bacterium]
MNKAEEYVYKVCQTKSFSAAAKELYVSQPALSKTIKKLETELGYEIFNRNRYPVTLTPEGEVYAEYLEEAITLENNLTNRIASMHEKNSKKLTVGGSNSAAYHIIPKVCGELNRRFRKMEMTIDIGETTRFLFDKLEQGALDIVIATNCDFSKFDAVKLWNEKYVVVVKKDYPGIEKLSKYALTRDEILSGNFSSDKEITDYKLFKDIEFYRPGINSNGWKNMSGFMSQCKPASFRPVNFHRMDMHYKLMLEGLGALIAPRVVISENADDKNELYYFSLGIENNIRQIMLVYKKDRQLTKSMQNFISVAKELFADLTTF